MIADQTPAATQLRRLLPNLTAPTLVQLLEAAGWIWQVDGDGLTYSHPLEGRYWAVSPLIDRELVAAWREEIRAYFAEWTEPPATGVMVLRHRTLQCLDDVRDGLIATLAAAGIDRQLPPDLAKLEA